MPPKQKPRRPQIPNVTSPHSVARRVVKQLRQMQEQQGELELVQLANEHADTDAVPGWPPIIGQDGHPLLEDGRPVFKTYGEAYAENQAQQARVWAYAEAQDVTGLVSAILAAEAAIPEE